MLLRFFIDEEGSKRANPLLQKALYLFAVFNSCANPVVYGIFNFKRARNDRNNTVKRITITFKNCQSQIKSQIESCGAGVEE